MQACINKRICIKTTLEISCLRINLKRNPLGRTWVMSILIYTPQLTFYSCPLPMHTSTALGYWLRQGFAFAAATLTKNPGYRLDTNSTKWSGQTTRSLLVYISNFIASALTSLHVYRVFLTSGFHFRLDFVQFLSTELFETVSNSNTLYLLHHHRHSVMYI
jgi:hypothetical protein